MTIQLPDLATSLQGRDLGHLKIVAGLWGVELNAPDAHVGVQRLAPALADRRLAQKVVNALPPAARQALDDLAENGGYLPWALFTRRYGDVRAMGAGKRDRERPYLSPESPAEVLWYRALIARGFFSIQGEPQEHAYIPADFLELISEAGKKPSLKGMVYGRPATSNERARPLAAGDRILDHTVTLLAALRMEDEQFLESCKDFYFHTEPKDEEHGNDQAKADLAGKSKRAAQPGSPVLSGKVLKELSAAAELLDEHGLPHVERTRAFLEAPRGEALALLARAWRSSPTFNELHQLPGLVCEGDWHNDPLRAREAILEAIFQLHGLIKSDYDKPPHSDPSQRPSGSRGTFWSLEAFVNAIRQIRPDYQRPSGDYDSWYIRRASPSQDPESEAEVKEGPAGEFLRGFEHWDEIDGALIRYIIAGPMYWLGLIDLATPENKATTTAFRLSTWAPDLLDKEATPKGLPAEKESVYPNSDGRVSVPRLAPRAARYQIARFCQWTGAHDGSDGVYHYRLSPASLERARQNGLRAGHLISLLRRYAVTVPPALARALERWEERGAEARLERLIVLRLSNPELLNTLRTSRAARFLGDPLGPTAVVVKPGAWKKVQGFLAEMGYLVEMDKQEDQ